MTDLAETERRAALEAAEARGMALFDAVERAGFVAAGRTESDVDNDIFELARADFGVERHWHKRIVRAGINTVRIYSDEPPVRVIEPDDTVYLDFGPVFGDWKADIGRSYALGSNPDKLRLVADLPRLFDIVQAHYRAGPGITGAQLFAFAKRTAENAGWLFGGEIAGHTIGEFPAGGVPERRERNHIRPENAEAMCLPDASGRARNWILEIHLVDKTKSFGGFYERLL